MKKLATISVLVACLLATSFTPALAENENDILFGKNYPFGKSNLLANSNMLSNSNSSEDSYSIMKPKRRKSSKRKGRRGGRGGSDIAFSQGKIAVDLGAGLGLFNVFPGMKTNVPPLTLGGEYCFWSGTKSSLGVGVITGFQSSTFTPAAMISDFGFNEPEMKALTDSLDGPEAIKFSTFYVGGKFTYYYNFNSNINFYWNIMVGYFSFNLEDKDADASGIGFTYNGVLPASMMGFKFYFTDNIGMYIEWGFDGTKVLGGGLALKF